MSGALAWAILVTLLTMAWRDGRWQGELASKVDALMKRFGALEERVAKIEKPGA